MKADDYGTVIHALEYIHQFYVEIKVFSSKRMIRIERNLTIRHVCDSGDKDVPVRTMHFDLLTEFRVHVFRQTIPIDGNDHFVMSFSVCILWVDLRGFGFSGIHSDNCFLEAGNNLALTDSEFKGIATG
jgi:hypothetical protein